MQGEHLKGLQNKTRPQLEKMCLDMGMAEDQIYAIEGGLLSGTALRYNIAKKREAKEKETKHA